MSTAAEPVPALAPRAGHAPARRWTVFTTVLTWAVFLQAVTAGRILAGDAWARDVHRVAAGLLVIAPVVGGLVALARLRDRAGGRLLGLSLVAMGVGLLVQHGLGTAAADGQDTLWMHVPLGVALVALMLRVGMLARRLGAPASAPAAPRSRRAQRTPGP